MPDDRESRDSIGKSFTGDRSTIRSFTGEPSEPTPLPADTPFSIGPTGGTAEGGSGGSTGGEAGASGGDSNGGASGDAGAGQGE
jgi:hypothetical protein